MKKIISLMLAFAMVFSMCAMPAFADELPTAKVVASLVGEVPEAGGTFKVAFTVKENTSGSFAAGEVNFDFPADVATIVPYYDGLSNLVGNLYQAKVVDLSSMGMGIIVQEQKFTATPSFPDGGIGNAVALSIPLAWSDQTPQTDASEFTMFELAFKLNEGFSYDDFYLTLTGSELFLGAKRGDASSSYANGALTLESIEKKEEVIYTNAIHQPGYGNEGSGIYALPETLTEGRTYEVSFDLTTYGIAGDTLIALNKADTMAASSYFGNSTIMMKVDGAEVKFRDGGSTNTVGTLSSTATTVSVLVKVDLINNTWDATYTEDGTVVADQKGMAFRNANLPIDALVLCDNKYNANCLTAKNLVVVDTTPASVGDVVFEYVDAEGNVLDTATMSGETGAEVAVAAKTITVGDVKYEAPAASGVVGTDEKVTVTCAKVEVVTISYTVNGEEVATATVEGVAGAEVAYASGKYATDEAVYSKTGTVTVDVEQPTVVVELDVVAAGIVGAAGQSAEAVNALDKQMTTAGTVTFDMTLIDPKDAIVALDNAAALADNYFAQSSAYIAIGSDGQLYYHDGTAKTKMGDPVALNATYSVVAELDVANKTWTVTVTDAEGTVVANAEAVSFRNTNVDVIDSIVVLDNAGAGKGAVVVSNLVVATDDEQPTEEPEVPSDEPSSEEPEVPSDEPSSEEPEVPSDEPSSEEPEVPSDEPSSEEPEVPSDEPSSEEPEVPSDEPSSEEPEVPSDEPSSEEPEVPSDEPSSEEPEVPSDEPSSEEPEVPSDEPSSEEPEVPSDEPSSEEPEVPSDEPSSEEPEVPSDEPSSEEPEVPSDEPSSEEPEDPSDEPSEEPGVVTLPLTATKKDAPEGKVAIDFVLAEDYEGEVELEAGDAVVIVISYLKDGKPYQAVAYGSAINADGLVDVAFDVLDDCEVAGVSILVGCNALEAITAGNLGTPVGVWK